jgi:hypothetical protein
MIKMAQLEDIRKMYFMKALASGKLVAGLVYTGIPSQNTYPWRNLSPQNIS